MPPPKNKTPNLWKINEATFNKIEEQRLKRNGAEQEKLKSLEFKFSSGSPFFQGPKISYHIPNQNVFDTIKSRLSGFYPPILLEDHIEDTWEIIKEYLPVIAHRNTLDGIDFIVKDREVLLSTLRAATANKQKAFIEGSKHSFNEHWAIALSFLATNGIGFREIYRPQSQFSDRPIENPNNLPFDSRFGRDVNFDISALHVAVADFPSINQVRCNVHIDKLTVTLGGLGDDVGISPSVINHFINELLFKTNLKGKLPDWILDAFDISVLNPDEGFLRAGISAALIDRPNLKWKISYSAGLNNNNQVEWSGNFKFEHSVQTGLMFKFDFLGG